MIQDDPEFQAVLEALNKFGERGLAPFMAKYRILALAHALEGDTHEIAKLVREGWELNEAEREFVADFLEGKLEPRQGRPPKHQLTRRIGLEFYWLTEHEGLKREAAVAEIQQALGAARSTVYEHLRAAQNCKITQFWKDNYVLMSRMASIEVVQYFREKDRLSR